MPTRFRSVDLHRSCEAPFIGITKLIIDVKLRHESSSTFGQAFVQHFSVMLSLLACIFFRWGTGVL
jgi:hypothetical protein